MPRDFDSTLIEEKNAQQNKPINLIKVHLYDGSNDLRLACYDEDVVFNSETYTKWGFEIDPINENNSGEIASPKVRVTNVNRVIQALIEQYDFRVKKVTVLTVLANHLDDSAVKRQEIFYILSYSADEQAAEFTLTSRLNILSIMLPVRLYMRNHCRWKFKEAECAYVGGETSCNKTLTRCRELSNQIRIGAFPSIPTRRVYI